MKLKIMTYNVHSCIDINKKKSLDRIAELVRVEKPDVIGLNEIESYSYRTGFVNQPRKLARLTDTNYHFGPTLKLGPVGFFGNGVLSGRELYNVQNLPLPGNREPRRCLKVWLDSPGGPVTVLVTHLGLAGGERKKQLAELVKIIEACRGPLILMGDFNCKAEELGPLLSVLIDTGSNQPDNPTYPAWGAEHRIDYIFTSDHFKCLEHYVVKSDASDHLPVAALLEMR